MTKNQAFQTARSYKFFKASFQQVKHFSKVVKKLLNSLRAYEKQDRYVGLLDNTAHYMRPMQRGGRGGDVAL